MATHDTNDKFIVAELTHIADALKQLAAVVQQPADFARWPGLAR